MRRLPASYTAIVTTRFAGWLSGMVYRKVYTQMSKIWSRGTIMRRKLFLFGLVVSILLCFSIVSYAEAALVWSRTYGGASWENAQSMVATPDGGYALAGFTGSFGAGNMDALLVKTDMYGNMEWNQTYGGTSKDYATSLVNTVDGGYAFAGFTGSFGAGFWVVKTDTVGNMQWNKTYEASGMGDACSLVATSDGGYAIASTYNYTARGVLGHGSGVGSGDFYLVKIDTSGNIQWNKTYGGTDIEEALSLVKTHDGGYALAGGAGDYYWLVKTDMFGNMQWNNVYGAGVARSLVVTDDGGYALAGSSLMIKTDSFGRAQWNKTYQDAWSIAATLDGGYVLAGWGINDSWLVKTDPFGNMEWNQTFGGSQSEQVWSVVATPDGGYALSGRTDSYSAAGDYDCWLVKVNESGVVPESFSLVATFLLLAVMLPMIIYKKRLFRTRS
jgi:hypothetical protein